MTEEFPYPPRVIVPPGLRTVLLGLGRAVLSAQPESIPHFSAVYFSELLRFRAENPHAEISELVREFPMPKANQLTAKRVLKTVDKRRDASTEGAGGSAESSGPDSTDKSPSSVTLDDSENSDSVGSGRKTRFLSLRNMMKKGKISNGDN
ncbi:calcium-binding tyrosine phosphorylation-regulated protein-like isoform X2 [Scleropages formosus]|nr:calcium-binding tyrosine phosphorylation-regulated protein isoform X2 [Scleropages formosus]